VITSFVVNFLVTRVRVERETLRDANQRLEVTNKALRIENVERKRAEEELRESQAKVGDYAETASDWFWEIGPDYKFTLLTENAFGLHAADRIGTACWDHAVDLEAEPEKWRLVWATLDSRKPFRDFVYRGLSGNGSPMYVRVSGKPVFGANGDFRQGGADGISIPIRLPILTASTTL
jgi:PAS domain-containing protein